MEEVKKQMKNVLDEYGEEKVLQLVKKFCVISEIQTRIMHLKNTKRITEINDFCYYGNSGEYYVYIYKHLNGDIFYVGKGKNNRCFETINRNPLFKDELDKKDAVLYIIAKSLSEELAEEIEFYLIYTLSWYEVPLTNLSLTVSNTRNMFDRYKKAKRMPEIKDINNLLRQIYNHKHDVPYLEYIQKGIVPTDEELDLQEVA